MLPGALLAQNEDAEALADLKACAALERGNARLACYDGVLGHVPDPDVPAAAIPAAAAAASVAVPSASPPPPRAGDAPKTIVVTELRLRTPSSAVFVTESGQVWEQSDSGRGRYPDTPFEATLEKGSLGSTFLISPAGGPRIRVRLRD
jgi:hypothetical protein